MKRESSKSLQSCKGRKGLGGEEERGNLGLLGLAMEARKKICETEALMKFFPFTMSPYALQTSDLLFNFL